MLQNIREGIQGPWAIGIIALIVVSFVFTGVSGYVASSGSNAVATVNDEEISPSELENAYRNERARLESQFGEAINSLFASENYVAQFRNDVLDRLINEKLVTQKAKALGLRVSDEQIKETIATLPEFQVNGSFDNGEYNNALSRIGLTPSEFAEYIRDQMTRQQFVQAINGSNFALNHQVNTLLSLQAQTRTANTIEIDIAKYQESVEVSEEEIKSYYDANLPSFDTQEQVKLAYVALSTAELAARVEVSEDEALQYYDENISYYTTQASRTVSHILLEFGEDLEVTRTEIKSILTRLENGEDFAELAASESDDIISAEDGGNLGEIAPGDYEGAFGDAVAALDEVGQLSGIVETDSGFHIIKLNEYTASVVSSFDEVKSTITEELNESKAIDEFFVLQQDMAQLAFEQPDSLDAVAEALNKPIIETPFFENGALPNGINYPQVADIAFSSELIDGQLNSELLELSDTLVMVVRVAEHKPIRTRSLDEVKDEVLAQLKLEKAQDQALLYAQNIQEKLNANESEVDLLQEQELEWTIHESLARNDASLANEIMNSIFALSPLSGENTSVVDLPSGNVAVVKLLSVNEAEERPEALDDVKQRYVGLQAQQTSQSFIESLREEAEIVINLP